MAELLDALQLLALHLLIGRPVSGGMRELMIGRGSRGYVARYGNDKARNDVIVNAVRGQREAGFSGGVRRTVRPGETRGAEGRLALPSGLQRGLRVAPGRRG